jgi:hypothetical protein
MGGWSVSTNTIALRIVLRIALRKAADGRARSSYSGREKKGMRGVEVY